MTEPPTQPRQRTKRLILAVAMLLMAVWVGLLVYTLVEHL